MNEQWQELKETITEMRDNDGTGTQQEVCKFLANLMDILEKQMQEPSGDLISRQAVNTLVDELARAISDERCCMSRGRSTATIMQDILDLPSVNPQEPKTGQYEKHIDHTDCIWYGNDSGCPVTCSQYRDGWNDAMDYIFKNGNGYQPYRHDG